MTNKYPVTKSKIDVAFLKKLKISREFFFPDALLCAKICKAGLITWNGKITQKNVVEETCGRHCISSFGGHLS